MNSQIQVCVTIYKKSTSEVIRCINSIPRGCDIRVDIDGGWECPDNLFSFLKLKSIEINIQDTNIGLSALRNLQLRACTKEFIWFVDSDDECNDKLELPDLGKHQDVIVSSFTHIKSDFRIKESRNIEVALGKYQTLTCIPSMIFRTKFLLDHHIEFDTSRFAWEDEEFLLKVMFCKPSYMILDLNSYYYYLNDDSLSRGTNSEKIDYLVESTIFRVENLIDLDIIYESKFRPFIFLKISEMVYRVLKYPQISDDKKLILLSYLKPYNNRLFK